MLKAFGETWEKMLSGWKWKASKENPSLFVLDGKEGPYIFTPYLAGCVDAWDSELKIEYTPEDDLVGIYLKYRPIKAKFKEDLVSLFEKHSPFQMTLSFDDNLTPVISREVSIMSNMIAELWRGNVCPQTDSRNNSQEMKHLMEYMARHHDDLKKTMSEEQSAIFEKFDDCWSEYASLAEEAIFEYAFKLGMSLAIETLAESE